MPVKLFRPILAGATLGERLATAAGAALGLAVTYALCAHLPWGARLPAIVAPLGASAVLAFAVPASPLAQPWSVIGGNTVSALVGVAVYRTIPDAGIAAGVAVGAAIVAMSLLRCLHPPGGAAALTAVIGGAPIHAAGFGFAFAPVGINSLLLVLLAVAFHRLRGHSYPHRPAAPAVVAAAERAAGFAPEDLDLALADMHESFDIDRADLDLLLATAETHARRRRAGTR
ncbi:HPP family protein [Sphingomonas jatrophae]|uniref:CBS domain-containing membrane protein n=1 Tax=Sphingomonas jatrophae TaxID=1166337 RepID=A0A1I6LQW8_9SPHN|nr:HPP family protein [Sphingomonas jatrophae]SFS05808.1 CBS domain-containing membrane protein [Sphingomonas jatrophae]